MFKIIVGKNIQNNASHKLYQTELIAVLFWAGGLSNGLGFAADCGRCKQSAVPWLLEHRHSHGDHWGYIPHDRLHCWLCHGHFNATAMAKVRGFHSYFTSCLSSC